MTDWIKAFNPTSPITTEAEAEGAARSSAVAMFIGAVVGVVSVAWTLTNPGEIQAAVASAEAANAGASGAASAAIQVGLWMAGGLSLLQLVLGIVQWRNPGKVLAILFLVLVIFGIVSAAAAPLMASAMPNIPATPIWQVALSIAILVVQLILLIAGLRGIGRLDRLQMESAR
ncbi:hypothetical protein [Brevundimonas subvibrioides]|uniref:hypothetical protein n=1 Tax=Brevundimonas subvibrioides TaxID=74313 RepID=UPI0022B46A14|nr:hypothetical protein [Brevundimonas subvibrioides]